jgi:hypothetical protein
MIVREFSKVDIDGGPEELGSVRRRVKSQRISTKRMCAEGSSFERYTESESGTCRIQTK